MIDVTNDYAKMIEAFECDFSLAADKESGHGLDEIQLKIEQHDEQIISDIELLKKLSFGIRTGNLRIVKLAGWNDTEVRDETD